MKILLVTMPRAASKMVLHNLYSYIVDATSTGSINLDEFLNQYHRVLFAKKASLENEQIVFKDPINGNVWLELINRFNIVKDINCSYVLKYFPSWDQRRTFLDTLPRYVDSTYYLVRRDLFSQALSFCVAEEFGYFSKNDNQTEMVKARLLNPAPVSEDRFRAVLKQFSWFNTEYVPVDGNIIYTESLEKIKTPQEFCDLFNLEFIDFRFTEFEKEFGNNKEPMISNLGNLKEIYWGMMQSGSLPLS